MQKFTSYLIIAIIFGLIGWFTNVAYHLPKSSKNPISQVKSRLLEKYSIENLQKADFNPGKIEIGEVVKDEKDYTSYKFSFEFSPDFSANLKKTSGLINIPKGTGPFPLIVMFRGYVDPETYFIGEGTQHAGEVFAQNGFITVAPDFLGYGESDGEAANVFESRFQTYVTAITLLKSLDSMNNWDKTNAFIWGHSNGGQIALTALEVTQASLPTVLWAPVSKPFPYSILYYTDESSDRGKFLRKELAKFEEDYDVEKYSLTNYLGNVISPLEIHQGTYDDAVPVPWTNELVKKLEDLPVDVDYIKHAGADHNMNPAWQTAVTQSLNFFQANLAK